MVEIEVVPRRWGNSLAVVIPANIVEKQNIRENKPIKLKFENERPKAGVLWGFAKDWKTPTQQMKDEMREGWMSETDRKEEEAWRAKQAKK